MSRPLQTLLLVAATLVSGIALAQGSIGTLIERLENGSDFRVRVQAALELGKTKSGRARVPLEGALDDDNAAVRAASAAALKVLGDPAAIRALEKHRDDSSAAVRSQIKSSIKALEGVRAASSRKVEMLVEVGRLRNGSGRGSRTLVRQFERASRKKFDDLPGVEVLRKGANSKSAAKSRRLPVVKVTGRLSRLERTKEGSSVVYSARVEFVVHKMPESAIRGTVSGTARASASLAMLRDRKQLAALRREALYAAVSSALRRAPDALRAAIK